MDNSDRPDRKTIYWLDEMHIKYGKDWFPNKSVPATLEETNAMLAEVLGR